MAHEKNKKAYRSIPINHLLKVGGPRSDNLNKKLNSELISAYEAIKLSDEEVVLREDIFLQFKRAIESEIKCEVVAYGSFRTGLMVYESDLDITILLNQNDDMEKTTINRVLGKVMNILVNANITDGVIHHIKNARIPILKCKDKTMKCKIDISINKTDAIHSADFVLDQIKKRPYIKYYLILLKYFLKRRQLSDAHRGGLCSYAQFLIILNFLKLHPLIQSGEISVVDNLGTLFMDFFQFYGIDFPFEKSVISVLDIKYKPNREGHINVDDPINPGHNVAWSCSALHLIRDVFNYSYKIMGAAFSSKVSTTKAIGELWLRLNESELRLRKKIISTV